MFSLETLNEWYNVLKEIVEHHELKIKKLDLKDPRYKEKYDEYKKVITQYKYYLEKRNI